MQEHVLWLELIINSIATIICLILLIIHARKILSESKSQNSEKTANSFTLSLLSITNTCSIICYFLGLFLLIPSYFARLLTISAYCSPIWFIGCSVYFLARTCNNLAFIIRLYVVYKGSIYQYNAKILVSIGIITILYPFAFLIVTYNVVIPHMAIFGDSNDYLIRCAPDVEATPKYPFAIGALYDIGFSISFMIAFINPLRKMIKDTKDGSSNKLIESGMKCAILVSVASFTSIINAFAVASGHNVFLAVDHITNIICLMLMTKYYRKNNYYSKLCCGAIKFSKWCMACCCCYKNDENVIKLANMVSVARKKTETPTGTSTAAECALDINPSNTPRTSPIPDSELDGQSGNLDSRLSKNTVALSTDNVELEIVYDDEIP